MKYILTFLFGAGCGVGGTLLWLRKDIKKRLETAENCDEMPFTMGDENTSDNNEKSTRSENTGSQGHSTRTSAKREQDKVDYHRIVSAVQSGEKGTVPVPIMPREHDGYLSNEGEDDVNEEDIVNLTEEEDDIIEIDRETFSLDDSNEKCFLTYFRGDKIVATESGAIVPNPAILLGPDWENWIGHYVTDTAFVRNPKIVTDYEIIAEDGLYEDEYGPIDLARED